jgi:hypothetical protein
MEQVALFSWEVVPPRGEAGEGQIFLSLKKRVRGIGGELLLYEIELKEVSVL